MNLSAHFRCQIGGYNLFTYGNEILVVSQLENVLLHLI